MQQKLPSVIWNTLFLMWLSAFISLAYLVQSKAGMGEGIVEGYRMQKAMAELSRNRLLSTQVRALLRTDQYK